MEFQKKDLPLQPLSGRETGPETAKRVLKNFRKNLQKDLEVQKKGFTFAPALESKADSRQMKKVLKNF